MTTIIGTTGDDTLFGDDDRDGREMDTTIREGSGRDDEIVGGAGDDTLYGGDGDDTLFGDDDPAGKEAGEYAKDGAYGNDDLVGGAGNDTLYGGDGDDTLFGDRDASSKEEVDGDRERAFSNDDLFGGAGNDTLYGGDGDDVLFGDDEAAWKEGAGGNDDLSGGAGDDTLYGGDGNDIFHFNADNLVARDSAAAVLLGEDAGNYTVEGERGATQGWSRDVLFGEYLVGGAASRGSDTMLGTSGNDIILMNTGDLYLDGRAQEASEPLINGIEAIDAGDGNDIVSVTDAGSKAEAGAFTLIGGTGDDVLAAGSGDDTVIGDFGSDDGSAGNNDKLFGGAGNDVIWGDNYGVSLGAASDGNDDIRAGAGNDVVFGAGGRDAIAGFSGDDTLYGGRGEDVVWGGTGDDIVYGGDGNDFLYGAGDSNTVNPHETNTLIGGGGNDWYMISRADGHDIIQEVASEGRVNNMVLFGQLASSGPDQFIAGSGVHDTPDSTHPLSVGYVLGSNSATTGVNLSIGGTSATLTYAANGGSVTFDTGAIQTITLWNPDLTYAGHTQEVFSWNGSTYAFQNYI